MFVGLTDMFRYMFNATNSPTEDSDTPNTELSPCTVSNINE